MTAALDFALDAEELAGCEWCGADHWTACACDPDADANELALHVRRLLAGGVSIGDVLEAETLTGGAACTG